MSSRMLPVPDGLDGMRVDVGLAKLLGLSRTVVAELAASGDVLIDGKVASKSDRLTAGDLLEVTLPEPDTPAEVSAEPVEGLRILHEDDDIVVVDKPVGVAVHPSPGWTDRPWLVTQPDCASRRRVRPNGRAWHIGWTPAIRE